MSYLRHSSKEDEDPFTESELVVRAQNKDQSAFETLYALYNSRLTYFLSNIVGDDAIGCELAQETFVKAWKSMRSLQDPQCFQRWLYQIARHCAYDYLQSKEASQKLLTVPLETCSGQELPLCVEGPERRVEQQELLRMALERVSPTYRECLVLFMFQRLPQRTIAEVLNMKEANVSAYVKRGKMELRQIYRALLGEQYGGEQGGNR